jgi:hypothetical protein
MHSKTEAPCLAESHRCGQSLARVSPMASLSDTHVTFLRTICLALLMSLGGCEKKGGQAVVLSKEYIPAAPADQEVRKEGQLSTEQWRVLVEMRADLRKVRILVKPAEWEKLKAGDNVNVRYSQGKYTGTIWGSEIE